MRKAPWRATLHVKCPHCGGMHHVLVRETYINNALADAAELLRAHQHRSWLTRTAPTAGLTYSLGGSLMGEFVFDVSITAVVRVRAETEADARQVLTSSALAARAPPTSAWPIKRASSRAIPL